MKIQGAKKVHYDSGPNMTPLVDVAMVILIFLMLAGTLDGIKHYLDARMPLAAVGPSTMSQPFDVPVNLNIELKHSNQNPTVLAYLDGNAYTIPDPSIAEEKGQEAKSLEAALIADRDRLVESGAARREDVQVIIAPNSDVKQQIVIKVYEAAYASAFTKIGFRMPRE